MAWLCSLSRTCRRLCAQAACSGSWRLPGAVGASAVCAQACVGLGCPGPRAVPGPALVHVPGLVDACTCTRAQSLQGCGAEVPWPWAHRGLWLGLARCQIPSLKGMRAILQPFWWKARAAGYGGVSAVLQAAMSRERAGAAWRGRPGLGGRTGCGLQFVGSPWSLSGGLP